MTLLSRDLLQGTPDETAILQEAFSQLQAIDAGKTIADAIQEKGTTIKFGSTDEDAIAQFDPAANEITIHESLKEANPQVLAAHLAHEGTHLQLGDPSSADDALDQEYQCFKAEAEVWNAVKGSEKDKICDDVSAMIKKGEADAKADIRRRYDEEYFTRWNKKR